MKMIRISGAPQLIQLSYFAEAGVFTLELLRNNTVEEKAVFVIASSLLLGILVKPTLKN
jgi:hypothetical protein